MKSGTSQAHTSQEYDVIKWVDWCDFESPDFFQSFNQISSRAKRVLLEQVSLQLCSLEPSD